MTAQRLNTFRALLKRHRDAAGLTQEELAGRSGLGVRTISNLERGVSKAPYRDTVRRLAKALDLSEEERKELDSARSPADGVAPEEESPPPLRGGFLGAVPAGRLVAREKEAKRISADLEEVSGGSGRTVFLCGEPGIGKTRLAQETYAEACERGFLVAAGRCFEAHAETPFYPFLEALSMLHGAAPPEVREGVPERWPYLARLLPDHYPAWGAPFPERAEESQWLFRAAAGFLREAASVRPVALLLDDLHWVDGASLDLLAHLARHTGGDRVFILGTYRDAEVRRGHPLRRIVSDLGRERLVERVRLRRLREEETASLLAERLGGTEVSGEFAGLMYEHTKGNPFFTVEALRALIERGDLSRWKGRWVRKEISGIEVPESVSEAISERASRLGRKTRETLEAASVLGQAFAFEEVRAVVGSGEEEVEAALDEAEGAGLLQPEEDSYAFNHPLTRQALYAELSPPRRKRLHRRTGEVIESGGERARRRRAAELARHFTEGGSPERAFPYAMLAGEGSEAVLAIAEAEHHYRQALRLAEETEDRTGTAAALGRLGATLTVSARCDEALAALERARKLARAEGDREGEVRAAAQTGLAHFYKGGAKSEFIEGLWKLAEELDAPGEGEVRLESLALLWRALSALLFTARRYEESLEAARRTSSLARKAGDDHAVIRAEMSRGQALIFLRRPEEAASVLQAAMTLAEHSGDTMNILFGALMLDLLDTARGDFERSLEWSGRGLVLAEQLGNPHEVSFRTARTGLIRFHRGEWKEAGDLLERASETSRSIGPMFLSAWAPAYLGALRMAEGEWEEAARLIKEAESLAGKVRWPASLRYALSLRAELDILEGRPEDAASLLEPVAALPEHDWLYATVLLSTLAWAHLESGDPGKAEGLADRAIEESAAMQNRVDDLGALRVKGMALARQGREKEAKAVFEEALSSARSMPHPYAEARILREYGKLCAGESAKELLSAAKETFRWLGATKDVENIDQSR